MLEEFADRIQNAKDKQYRMLERFHVGDTVYPFWLHNFIVYGTVIDIDKVARKVICDFNGIARQFCPEDLMLVNPAFVQADSVKVASERKLDRKGYQFYCVLEDGSIESGWEFNEDAIDRQKEMKEDGISSKVVSRRTMGDRPDDNANWHRGRIAKAETHLSPDTDNGIDAVCKECGGEIAVSYDEKRAVSDFVCTKCGKRIPESRLSEKSKKAMRERQAAFLKCAKENVVSTPNVLERILMNTLKYLKRGAHCYCLLPSGNWFSTEPDDNRDGLDCFITENVDREGYPDGLQLWESDYLLDSKDECGQMAREVLRVDGGLHARAASRKEKIERIARKITADAGAIDSLAGEEDEE